MYRRYICLVYWRRYLHTHQPLPNLKKVEGCVDHPGHFMVRLGGIKRLVRVPVILKSEDLQYLLHKWRVYYDPIYVYDQNDVETFTTDQLFAGWEPLEVPSLQLPTPACLLRATSRRCPRFRFRPGTRRKS